MLQNIYQCPKVSDNDEKLSVKLSKYVMKVEDLYKISYRIGSQYRHIPVIQYQLT